MLKYERNFLGCFDIKQLPPFPQVFPCSLIVRKGYHWLSLIFTRRKKCFYFDSFGEKIKDKCLITYLRKYHFISIVRSIRQIQADSSDKCGFFCVLFIKLVKTLSDFKHFLLLFYKNKLLRNDSILEYILFKVK